jgi:prepilin-type N-terminal cleavage/methylation domain-containing protein
MRERAMAGARVAQRRARLQVRRAAGAQDGFTLPEVLVVLVVLGIVLVGITQLLTSGLKAQTDQTNRTQAQQHARLGLDKLRREIRCASALTTPSGYPASAITIMLGSYCPTAGGAVATVTWCTKPAASGGQPYTLWRYTGSACSGTGTKWASNLVNAPSISAGKIFDAAPVDTPPTKLTDNPLTVPSSGTFAINVASTSSFNAGANTIFFGPSGPVTCTAVMPTSFTGCSGGQAGQYPQNMPVYSASSTRPPRARLSVSLALDETPADAKQRFLLNDDIVLRNSQPF